MLSVLVSFFFFFNDTATTEIYTLSLHDALPICCCRLNHWRIFSRAPGVRTIVIQSREGPRPALLVTISTMSPRSEEHTSELQSQSNLVCRLLLEKKKKNTAYV